MSGRSQTSLDPPPTSAAASSRGVSSSTSSASTRHAPARNASPTVRPSSCGCPATRTAANSSTRRSTGIAPRIWRPIIAPANAGADRCVTLRLRVSAPGCAARRVRYTAVAKSSSYSRSTTRSRDRTERAYSTASRLVVSTLVSASRECARWILAASRTPSCVTSPSTTGTRSRRAVAMPRASGSASTHTTGMSISRSRVSTRVPILPRPSRTTCPPSPRGGLRRAVALRKVPRASSTAASSTGSSSRPTKPESSCSTCRPVSSLCAGSLMANRSSSVTYVACSGWSPVTTISATASATTHAPRPASDHRSRRENSSPNGGTPARAAGSGGPEYDTCSRTTVPRPVAASTAAASGSSCGAWSPLPSEPSAPAGSLLVADSRASVHSPGSATSPGRGGCRSTARSSRPSVSTTLLVPTSAVAASAGAAVSASDSTVVDVPAPSSPASRASPVASAALWSSSSSMCWPSRRLYRRSTRRRRGLSRRAARAARMFVSSSSYTRASAAARSTPARVSTSSVGSAASSSRPPSGSPPPGSPVPERLTAALTLSSSAAEAARARPTAGRDTPRPEGGTTSVTCSR